MPRIDVPPERDPIAYFWSEMAPSITPTVVALNDAVYSVTSLSLGEFEAARITIARINDCAICKGWRTPRPGEDGATQVLPEEFYRAVEEEPERLTRREQLSAEFARRFAVDHLGIDDALWAALRGAFSDKEISELALCVAAWMAFGRVNRVFDIDGGCQLPPGATSAAVTGGAASLSHGSGPGR